MGLLLAQLLRQSLAREIAVADLAPNKLALAQELGVATLLNVQEIDLPAYAEDTGFYDVVIEATGAADMIERAGALLKTRGRLVVFADHHLHIETIAWRNFMLRSLSVAFTNPGFHPDFKGVCWRTAVGLMQAGLVRQQSLISHRLPAAQCQQLMDIAVSRDPAYIKGYLAWE